MGVVINVLHIIVCFFLVAVVLLQRGKGAQVGAVFGGGGGTTMFGARGAGNFLTKLTTGAAAVFMITSLSLSYLGVNENEGLFDDETLEELEGAAPEPLFEEVEGRVVEPEETGAESPSAPRVEAEAAG